MPKQIQNANLTTALVNEYDLKGSVSLELDTRVVPVVLTQDLTPNPNAAGNPGMRRQNSIGVVGQISFTFIVPGPGTRLEVLKWGTEGDLFHSIAMLRAAEHATLEAAVTLGSLFQSIARFGSSIPAATINPTLQAGFRSGSIVAPAVGQDIWSFNQAAGVLRQQVIEFDPPIVLYGRPNIQPAGVVMWHLTANTSLDCSAVVREFPDE